MAMIGWIGNYFGGGTPMSPVSKIPSCTRDRRAVTLLLSCSQLALSLGDFLIHMGEPGRRHEVGMTADLPVRQFLDRLAALDFTNKSSAHGALPIDVIKNVVGTLLFCAATLKTSRFVFRYITGAV